MTLLVSLALASLPAQPAESVQHLVAAAWKATVQGNFVEGEALAGRARRAASPDDAASIEHLAAFQRDLGFPLRAEQIYRAALADAVARGQSPVKLRILLGAHLSAAGRTKEAIAELEQAAGSPGIRHHHQIFTLLAAQYEEAGAIDKAESALRRKLALTPGEAMEVVPVISRVGICGGVLEAGLFASRNELAEFFARTGQAARAEHELRLAVERSGADLRTKAGALLALEDHLSARGDLAAAGRIQSRLRLMAAGAAGGPDHATAIELRITLARKAGGEAMWREFAVIREEARAVLGSGSWPYMSLSMQLGLPLEPPPSTAPAMAAPSNPAPPAPVPQEPVRPADPVAHARQAVPYYPALLKQIAVERALRGEHEWFAVLDELAPNEGPEGELERIRLRLRVEQDDAARLSLWEREYALVEQLQGPHARPLVRLSGDLAEAWSGDWPRAFGMWRRHSGLSQRFHGRGSREHFGALLRFAHDAGWADEYPLALELVDEASGLARGNRELQDAAESVRKTILTWRGQ